MRKPSTVSIDGPAGSGKSTIGQKLADQLNYMFIDAGMLYRAITEQVILETIALSDQQAVTDFAQQLSIEVENPLYAGIHEARILIEGIDIRTAPLHSSEINQAVPIIAAYPEVREIVRAMQRAIAAAGCCVLAGRDIGTVVLPQADLKIYLWVSLEERVQRRYEDARRSSSSLSREQIVLDLQRRDYLDSTRLESPMKIPEDAVVVKTDGMTPEEVVSYLLQEFFDCE